MKEIVNALIPLSQGRFTLVDESDVPLVNTFPKWYAHKETGGHWYAWFTQYVGGYKNKIVRLHRLILKAPNGLFVDHINGNGLDNRRCNLRLCSHRQNIMNTRSTKGSSKFKGVSFFKRDKKWRAYIKVNYNQIHLGYFGSEIDAALAYDAAALKHFGEFARPNLPALTQNPPKSS